MTFSSGHLKLSVLFGQGGFRVAEGPEAEDYFLSVSSSLWKEISDHGGVSIGSS